MPLSGTDASFVLDWAFTVSWWKPEDCTVCPNILWTSLLTACTLSAMVWSNEGGS